MQPPFYKFILDTLVEGAVIEDASSVPELQTLLTEAGMTLLDYVNCDLDLATNQTLVKDWESNLLASIREEKNS